MFDDINPCIQRSIENGVIQMRPHKQVVGMGCCDNGSKFLKIQHRPGFTEYTRFKSDFNIICAVCMQVDD